MSKKCFWVSEELPSDGKYPMNLKIKKESKGGVFETQCSLSFKQFEKLREWATSENIGVLIKFLTIIKDKEE